VAVTLAVIATALVGGGGRAADSPIADAARRGRSPSLGRPTLVGNAAPEIGVLRWFNHSESPLLFTGKITLIDFWGTSCGVCVATLPAVERLARALGPRVQVVLVHGRLGARLRTTAHGDVIGEMVPAEEVLPKFIAERKVALPVAVTDTLTFRKYTAGVVPLYVVVDGQGVIRFADSHPPPLAYFQAFGPSTPARE